MNTVSKNIKKLRQKKGCSQGVVAKTLVISVPAYSKIETGTTDINISRLHQIAAFFQVDLLDLLCEVGLHPSGINDDKLNELTGKLSESRNEVIGMQVKLIMLFDDNRDLQRRLRVSGQSA
jgi:transcriptional regulator with XRE-family HTH domain